MAGVETLEIEVQLNMTADRFFDNFKKKEESFTDKTRAIYVHRDDPTSNFSIQTWNFFIEGKMEMVKEEIVVDEENKSISFLAIDGNALKIYKSFKVIIEVVPKPNGVCIAKWKWEYEKLNDDVPPPTKYATFVAQYMRDLETRFLSQS